MEERVYSEVTERRAADNSHLASCGETWVNSSSVFRLNFCAGLTVLCSETRPNAKHNSDFIDYIYSSYINKSNTFCDNATHKKIEFAKLRNAYVTVKHFLETEGYSNVTSLDNKEDVDLGLAGDDSLEKFLT